MPRAEWLVAVDIGLDFTRVFAEKFKINFIVERGAVWFQGIEEYAAHRSRGNWPVHFCAHRNIKSLI